MKLTVYPHLKRLAGFWLWAMALQASLFCTAQAEQRVALLIGNSSYQSGPLRNPPNDVKEMEAALKAVGFKVQKVLNANQGQMKRAVRDFGALAQGADVAMLYYSGHGTQAQGENYLIPVGAAIDKEADYEVEAVSVNSVLRQIVGAHPKAAIVVLDACRDNPYASATRGGPKGLARMDAPTGTMVAFATAPGTTASDEGYYAKVLASQIKSPGVELLDVFRNTTVKVRQLSQGKQEPRISEVSITDRIYLAGGAGPETQVASLEPQPIATQMPGRKPTPTTTRPTAAEPTPVADPAETAYWAEVVKSQSETDVKAYIQTYPKGAYVHKAQQLLDQQSEQKRQQEQGKEDLAWANAEQANDYNRYTNFTNNYPNSRYTPLAKLKASKLQPQAGQIVQDCAECPKMVVIPSGRFTLGSNEYEHEKPPRQVNVNSYLLGQTLVTQGQWRAIMGSNPSHFANCGDTCPVENINWNDAQAFATALSKKTGMNYRLPSEAEWEYAARAGTNTKWSFGDNESELGQYAWYSANSNNQTHPVAQMKPNAWSLNDMHGNAWEWVQDVYHDSYSGAPTDGSAWTSGGIYRRYVLRGGSWNNVPGILRSANRIWRFPEYRSFDVGLRIARTL